VCPPQKPVTKNHLSALSVRLFFSKKPIKTPIKKQPITFVIKVVKGKVQDENFETKTEVRNRKTLAKAPPIAI